MSRRKEKGSHFTTMDKGFCFAFSPPTAIAEEPSKTSSDNGNKDKSQNCLKPSAHSRRSASLFCEPSPTFGFSIAECARRFSGKNKTKGLVRRFSSPLFSTTCSKYPAFNNGLQTADDSQVHGDHCDGAAIFRNGHGAQERELVSRSVSLRLDDDTDIYESFTPSDLDVKELLGKGFYGEVFKVIHKKTGRPMVLKKLYRMDAKCEQDFVKEAAVMRQLHHPNVLRFLGVLYSDKKLQLVTEYVSGGTLRQLLDSPDELPWNKRLAIAKDVASGMTYLHSMNIIHRDLNSGNILIREETLAAVVADFGLARVFNRRRAGRRRRLTVVGDPYLMAPEMAREEPYNERVDVFSYGITLCEIIGRCSSDPDIMPRRKDFGIDQQRFLAHFVDESCPRPFLELAFKCASVNPDKRPLFDKTERWLTEMLDQLNDEEGFDEICRQIEAFGENEQQIQEEITSPESSASPMEQSTPQKRRRSTDMGYASGRSEGESPRDADIEMTGAK